MMMLLVVDIEVLYQLHTALLLELRALRMLKSSLIFADAYFW